MLLMVESRLTHRAYSTSRPVLLVLLVAVRVMWQVSNHAGAKTAMLPHNNDVFKIGLCVKQVGDAVCVTAADVKGV
jgi:hypothetical protein